MGGGGSDPTYRPLATPLQHINYMTSRDLAWVPARALRGHPAMRSTAVTAVRGAVTLTMTACGAVWSRSSFEPCGAVAVTHFAMWSRCGHVIKAVRK